MSGIRWFIMPLVCIDFSSSGVRVHLHPKWVSVSTTDLGYALCCFSFPVAVVWPGQAGWGEDQVTSRHAGSFVSSGEVKCNPFFLNMYSLARSVYVLAQYDRGVGSEIFSFFSLALVAVLPHITCTVSNM